MTMPKSANDRIRTSHADVGARDGQKCAQRSVPVFGLSASRVAHVSGNGAAPAAAADISAFQGRDIVLSTTGDVFVRFQQNAANLVTVAIWDFAVQGGTSIMLLLPDGWTHLSAWGVGGAWNLSIHPVDGV